MLKSFSSIRSYPFAILLALVISVSAVYSVVSAFHPHSVSAKSPTEIWSIDLGADSDFHNRLSVEEVLLDTPKIDFLNESHLICGFYSTAKTGTGDEKVISGYHVLEIAARDGSPEQRLEFNAFESGYSALHVADGGFVVFAGDKVQKFSDQFEPGPVYPAPRVHAGSTFDRWLVDVSPSGQTAALYSHRPGEDQGTWIWLRTTDLAVIKSAQAPRTLAIQSSDDAGTFSGVDGVELLSKGKTTDLCSHCKVYFLTNELLFLDHRNSYSIETINGDKRFGGDLDVGGGDLARAAHATRFAFMAGHYIGSGFPIRTQYDSLTGKIVVLDWSNNKEVAEIAWTEPAGNPSAGLSQMALALSPDGRYLAVLLHHTLTLYRLP